MEVRQIILALESLGLAQAGLIGQGRQRAQNVAKTNNSKEKS